MRRRRELEAANEQLTVQVDELRQEITALRDQHWRDLEVTRQLVDEREEIAAARERSERELAAVREERERQRVVRLHLKKGASVEGVLVEADRLHYILHSARMLHVGAPGPEIDGRSWWPREDVFHVQEIEP